MIISDERYWRNDRGQLCCSHGVILYGNKCISCEKETGADQVPQLRQHQLWTEAFAPLCPKCGAPLSVLNHVCDKR